MINPFEEILKELQEIKELLITHLVEETKGKVEIIDRPELMKRLGISEPTTITWGKKGKIPEIRIGSIVRYNWQEVIKSLSISDEMSYSGLTLDALGLPTPITNALKTIQVYPDTKIDQFIRDYSERLVLQGRGMGNKSLNILKQKLLKQGFELKK